MSASKAAGGAKAPAKCAAAPRILAAGADGRFLAAAPVLGWPNGEHGARSRRTRAWTHCSQ